MDLPKAYLTYMQDLRAVEGELTVEPGWFQLWPIDELDKLNQDYSVSEFVPDFRAFGSSGGGEMLAFDPENRVVMIPFVTMEEGEARVIAENWAEFETKMLTEPLG
jgi:hypothetical protein